MISRRTPDELVAAEEKHSDRNRVEQITSIYDSGNTPASIPKSSGMLVEAALNLVVAVNNDVGAANSRQAMLAKDEYSVGPQIASSAQFPCPVLGLGLVLHEKEYNAILAPSQDADEVGSESQACLQWGDGHDSPMARRAQPTVQATRTRSSRTWRSERDMGAGRADLTGRGLSAAALSRRNNFHQYIFVASCRRIALSMAPPPGVVTGTAGDAEAAMSAIS